MKGLKNYFKKFTKDESGTAIIEWVIVLAIVAVLVPIIMTVSNSASTKINDTADRIDSIDIN